MKIIPQDRSQSVFPVSCLENLNLPDAISRYNSKKSDSITCITFIGPESDSEILSDALLSPDFESRFCPSLEILLRSGLYQNSNIFVFTKPVHTTTESDANSILSNRCQTKIKVLLWKDSPSVESLKKEISSATEEIALFDAKETIAEDILNRSRESLGNGSNKETSTPPEGLVSRNSDHLDEKEFREFIRLKLESHLDSSPEQILSKAIEIIKR